MTAPITASVRAGDRERERTANQLGSGTGAGLPRDGRIRDPAAGHVRRSHHRRAARARRRPAARRSFAATIRAPGGSPKGAPAAACRSISPATWRWSSSC